MLKSFFYNSDRQIYRHEFDIHYIISNFAI